VHDDLRGVCVATARPCRASVSRVRSVERTPRERHTCGDETHGLREWAGLRSGGPNGIVRESPELDRVADGMSVERIGVRPPRTVLSAGQSRDTFQVCPRRF
jgi:hypothetical protein